MWASMCGPPGEGINAHGRKQHNLFHAVGKHLNPHAARKQVTNLQGTFTSDSRQLVTKCACMLQGYRETLSVFLPGKLLTSCCAVRKGGWGQRLIGCCMHGQELICLLATPKVHLADIFYSSEQKLASHRSAPLSALSW